MATYTKAGEINPIKISYHLFFAATECNGPEIAATVAEIPDITRVAYVYDSEIHTLLHTLAMYGCADLVSTYIASGLDPDMKIMIREFKVFGEHKLMDETQRNFNKTPLMFAAEHNKIDVLDILIGAGADVTKKTKPDGDTIMHIAVKKNNQDLVTKLLEMEDNNLEETNVYGQTPLEVANSLARTEIIGLIEDHLAALEPEDPVV